MESNNGKSKIMSWVSYIIQGLIVLMLLMGAVNNILQTEISMKGAAEMGYPANTVFYLGIVLLISTILYVIPKTAFIGGILLTAWLGGAVASHVMNADPLFNILFPAIFGILVWLSLWLRNDKIQSTVGF